MIKTRRSLPAAIDTGNSDRIMTPLNENESQ